MGNIRDIHPDFFHILKDKDIELIELYADLREFILTIHPDSNELLYHTHALTSVYSVSEKLSDAFCMIPIYTNHFNLGFNKGTLIEDPHKLLTGTGNLIRHIPIKTMEDYRNDNVEKLVRSAIELAIHSMQKSTSSVAATISKIK
jgi:hypothetical protein